MSLEDPRSGPGASRQAGLPTIQQFVIVQTEHMRVQSVVCSLISLDPFKKE